MQPLLVVHPFQKRWNVRQHIRERIELQQVHALTFEPTKERFNLGVVGRHADPTHADLHVMLLEHPNVPFARILDGLITNDKFCFTRKTSIQLQPNRRINQYTKRKILAGGTHAAPAETRNAIPDHRSLQPLQLHRLDRAIQLLLTWQNPSEPPNEKEASHDPQPDSPD
jgi:hypothetical protein